MPPSIFHAIHDKLGDPGVQIAARQGSPHSDERAQIRCSRRDQESEVLAEYGLSGCGAGQQFLGLASGKVIPEQVLWVVHFDVA